MLSIMSIDETPVYPAPDNAWSVTTLASEMGPNFAWRAANGTTIPITALAREVGHSSDMYMYEE